MTKKVKIVLITFVLMGSFSYSYAGWFGSDVSSVYDQANSAAGKGNDSEAVRLYKQACIEDDFQGCNAAGDMYKYGKGVQKDLYKAKEFYLKACNNGFAHGCNSLETLGRYFEQENQSIQRLAQYEIDYLKEYEEIKNSTPKTTLKWIQPKNKKMPCKIAVPDGDDDPTKDKSYSLFWDGDCKDGYAFGLGREIEKANMVDAWQIGIYEKGIAQGYYLQQDILNNSLREGEINYYGSASVVERYVEEKNGNLDLTFVIGKTGGLPQEPDLVIANSPFWNNTQVYRKQFPNFRYEYVDYKNNDIENIDFNFQLVNKDNQRNGWGFEKNKNATIVKGEYINGEPNPSELPSQYMNKADSIIKEVQEAYDKALEAQRQAHLVKKQYLRKICKDSVKVNFMDNTEYKEICDEKAELRLEAKVDRKLEQLEKEKVAIIQKQQQEIAQQKQNEQLRQQQAYQQQQLNIQRQQQQRQYEEQQSQKLSNALNQFQQDMSNLNQQQIQYNQQYQTDRQLRQINNNLRGIRYGY